MNRTRIKICGLTRAEYVIFGWYDSLVETEVSVFADLSDARKEFDRIIQEYLDNGSEIVFSSDYETKKTIDIFSYFTFACFMCTFKEIVDALENICCKKNGGYRHEVRPFAFDLYEDQPLSDSAHLKQSYFFKSNEDTDICVMFSNCSDGWFTLVNVLSKAIQCEACLFSITSSDVLYGALNGFHYINNGKSIRTVYAMQDPHWVFYEDGKQLWFEDGNHYKQHTIKKRMNKEILVSYCTRLGFDIYSPQFWQSKQSVLLAELPRNRKK